jgi:hypothetical protein
VSAITIAKRSAALVLAALALGLASVSPAPAAIPPITDAVGDAGAAPDLTGLTVTYAGGDADAVGVKVSFAGGGDLPAGSTIVVGLDTDRNPATGADGGADYLIDLQPVPSGVAATFSRWHAGRYEFFSPADPVLTAGGNGELTFYFCLCDLGDPTAFGIFARSELADSSDMLPDTGTAAIDLPVVYSVLLVHPLPVAGKAFQTAVQGIRLANDRMHIVQPQSATCSAKLAGKSLALTGRCRWRLPPGASGQQIAISITVRYAGETTTFNHSYPVD